MMSYQNHLHRVKTEDEYKAYADSSDFKTPNVCYVTDTSIVHYSDSSVISDKYSVIKYTNGDTLVTDTSILTHNLVDPFNVKNISSVNIGENVLKIDSSAFASQSANFKNIYFSKNSILKEIGDNAFHNSQYFESELVFPDSLISIGDSAFYSCAIHSIKFNDNLTTIGPAAFTNLFELDGNIKFPKSLKTIGHSVFENSNVIDVSFGDSSLDSIPANLFRRTYIKKIVIPKTIKYIGDYAFFQCFNLTEMTILNDTSVIVLGLIPFLGDSLTNIYVPSNLLSTYQITSNWTAANNLDPSIFKPISSSTN